MPPLPETAGELYRILQRLQLVLIAAGRRAWGRMDPADFDRSWTRIAPALTVTVAAGQLAAARAATEYVPAVLEETGQPDEPAVRIRPEAFAGVASDGRSLAGLLGGSVRLAKVYVARGHDGGDALALGQRWLDSALRTTVTDAARDTTAAEIIARPGMQWVRMINPPCCSRCAVLAGRTYSWDADFDRHTNCDCMAIPVTVANADSYLADPRALVERGLITDLTKAQRQRIDDGADLPRVLNESRDRWRERMAAQRRTDKEAAKRASWGSGDNLPPPGTSIHDLFGRLTSQVEATRALQAAGIAR